MATVQWQCLANMLHTSRRLTTSFGSILNFLTSSLPVTAVQWMGHGQEAFSPEVWSGKSWKVKWVHTKYIEVYIFIFATPLLRSTCMHMGEKEETSRGNLSQIPVIHHYRGSGDALSVHLWSSLALAVPAIGGWCVFFRNGARRAARALKHYQLRNQIVCNFARACVSDDIVTKSSNITSRPLLFVATGYCTTGTAFGEIGQSRARGGHSSFHRSFVGCLRVSKFLRPSLLLQRTKLSPRKLTSNYRGLPPFLPIYSP